MNRKRLICTMAVCTAIFTLNTPVRAQIKVACVGTSITQFFHYPDSLQSLLGSGYTVGNFGLSGASAIRIGNVPYITQTATIAALVSMRPDIVVIELGANDNPQNVWSDSAHFIRDYEEIIDTINRKLEYTPRMFLCWPTAQTTTADGRSNTTIHYGIIPRINQIAAGRSLPTIDLYSRSADTSLHLLSDDGLHPRWEVGADTIAHLVYRAITARPTAAGRHTGKLSDIGHGNGIWKQLSVRHGVLLAERGSNGISVRTMTLAGRRSTVRR